jgi:hypothetical protein
MVVLAVGTGVCAHAQVGIPRAGKGKAKQGQGIIDQKQLKQQKQDAIVERFLQMSPEERKEALKQLPPARQKLIMQRLQTLELLTDDERRMLRGRLQTFAGLEPNRRKAVRAELQNLRAMSPADRRRRLASDEFQRSFSNEERQLLYDVSGEKPDQE